MNILVTGGAGFIGSNLVDELVKSGHYVTVIDNESSPSNTEYYWNNQAKNYKLDICNYEETKFIYQGIDAIFHVAAQTRIQNSIKNPDLSMMVNSYGTSVVLRCAIENNVKKIIYSSTSSIYGNNMPNTEDQKEDCLNIYSLSKKHGEDLCILYSHLYGLESIILRYFNVYGNRQSTEGEYSTLIGNFLSKKNKGIPLEITGDGEQRRDFTNVADIVKANMLFLDTSNLYGEIFNVGSGENYSVNEIAKMISKDIEYIPRRIGENNITLANIDKIKKHYNWSPSISLQEYLKHDII